MTRRGWGLVAQGSAAACGFTLALPWLGATGSENVFQGYPLPGQSFDDFETVAFSLGWLPIAPAFVIVPLGLVQFNACRRAAGGGRSNADWAALGAAGIAVGTVLMVIGLSRTQGFVPTRAVFVALALAGVAALCSYRVAEPVAAEVSLPIRTDALPNRVLVATLGLCGALVGLAACAPWASIASTEAFISTSTTGRRTARRRTTAKRSRPSGSPSWLSS